METNNNFNQDISINTTCASNAIKNDKNQMDMPPNMQGTTAYQICYPEIFYRLQPYIFMVCDQMDTFGTLMPTQEMVEQLTDSIHDDVCKMYPDMSEYARDYDKKMNESSDSDTSQYGLYRDYRMFDRRTRRRGMLRDLIDILLLQEFFRRRRRYY